MLSRKTIEACLFFLLRHRVAVSIVVGVLTLILAGFMWFRMHVFTNFFDLYPPSHPYIKLYQQYRTMFGTANTLLLVVEVQNGTLFDDPDTIQKVVGKESDANTKIYVSGPPILYAYFLEIMPKMVGVLAASIVMILLILWEIGRA